MYDEFAAGGMASVHLGTLGGPGGFCRTVAIKRLHRQYSKSPDFRAMFLDEARLAARIRHPNVVATVDVLEEDDELFLVMEYANGQPLSQLLQQAKGKGGIAPTIVASLMTQALLGLHAVHEAVDANGQPLHIVHRDFSPQNLLVVTGGVARVLDFGIAKAKSRLRESNVGELKGKVSYMSPEQVMGGAVDHRADIFAAGVVAWEAFTGTRLFPMHGGFEVGTLMRQVVRLPTSVNPNLPRALDAVLMKALARDPADRFQDAMQFAEALESVVPSASPFEVSKWLNGLAAEQLIERERRVSVLEEVEARELASGNRQSGVVTAISNAKTVPQHLERTVGAPRPAPSGWGSEAGGNRLVELLRRPLGNWRLLGGSFIAIGGALVFISDAAVSTPMVDPPAPISTAHHRALPTAVELNELASPVAPAAMSAGPTPTTAPALKRTASSTRRTVRGSGGTAPGPSTRERAEEQRAADRGDANGAPPEPQRAASVAPAACSPPFVLGSDGLKHFKPDCF